MIFPFDVVIRQFSSRAKLERNSGKSNTDAVGVATTSLVFKNTPGISTKERVLVL